MKIALCQINPTIGDLEGNTKKVLSFYEKAKELGAELAVFPELALTGYTPSDMLNYKPFVDKQIYLLEMVITPKITKECAVILGGVTYNYWSGKPYYNSAIFIVNRRIEYIANKRLIPNYDLFNEDRYFESGTHQVPFEYKGTRIGLSVCEDMWRGEGTLFNKLYKDNPIEKLAIDGADVLINISASPFYKGKDHKRHNLLKKYSAKWKLPFIMVNTVGANTGVLFDGRSKVYDINGNLLSEASAFREDIILYDTEANSVYSKNLEKISKIDILDELEATRKAIVLGLRDYIEKQGFLQFIIGMSGGIDSALVASLAVEAVGAENVHCVTMPTRFSSKGSIEDSINLCNNLGVDLARIPIEKLFQNYMELFKENFGDEVNTITMENIQARIRGNILMAYSNNLEKALVLATGNKSEIAVGYNTLYGDTNGALAPIGDLYKTDVYRLANWLNRDSELIPYNIINKAPTAELNVNQLDQDTLPEYDVLDTVLRAYIDEEKTVEEIYDETHIDKSTINWVIRRVSSARYKRYQLPPIIKLSRKAFEIDRKWQIVYNIDWMFKDYMK